MPRGLRAPCSVEGPAHWHRRAAPPCGGCFGGAHRLLERRGGGAEPAAGVGRHDPVHAAWHYWPPARTSGKDRTGGPGLPTWAFHPLKRMLLMAGLAMRIPLGMVVACRILPKPI